MSELLPCPFCGHSASLQHDDDHRWAQVVCGGCGAKGMEAPNRDALAVNYWNRRTVRSPQTVVRAPPRWETELIKAMSAELLALRGSFPSGEHEKLYEKYDAAVLGAAPQGEPPTLAQELAADLTRDPDTSRKRPQGEPPQECARCDDTGCPQCDPDWAANQAPCTPEQQAAIDRVAPRRAVPAQGEPLTDEPVALLPCPFCGSEARFSVSGDREVCNVRCARWLKDCLGAGANCSSAEEAIAAWNRRAAPSVEPPVVALRDERAAFEEWARKRGYGCVRAANGPYVWDVTEAHWRTWQARAALKDSP